MQKTRKYLLFILGVSLLLAFSLAATAGAKSLYVIADINAYQNIPIRAYDIQGTNLVYQWTGYIPDRNGGAVGLTIDTDSEYLFVTFEFSGVLDIVNAKTMTRIGQVTAPSAGNLAGIVVDQDKQRVYAVDRRTNHLYVYDWDPTGPTLTLVGTTYISLANCSQAYGIALDEVNDILYVGDNTRTIKSYNTSDWSYAGGLPISQTATGVAVDASNRYVYSTDGGPSGGYILSQYNLATNTEDTINVGSTTLGVAVDPETDMVYITTYGGGTAPDRLIAYDSSLTQTWTSGDIGNPTGLCVPGKDVIFNPLNLEKQDNPDPVICGNQITYTVCFDNSNNPNTAVDNIYLTDAIPDNTTLVSYQVITEPPEGTTISDDGTTVTWDVGTVAGGAGSYCMEMVVQVDPNFGGNVIENVAYIYWSIGGLSSFARVTETTDVIPEIIQTCDVNNDSFIDIDDIRLIGAHRGTTNPLYDIDGDGVVTTSDARQCVFDCDNPRCAITAP